MVVSAHYCRSRGIAVTVMVYNSGGKVTVTGSTYMDHDTSEVLSQHDTYIRTDVTREKA